MQGGQRYFDDSCACSLMVTIIAPGAFQKYVYIYITDPPKNSGATEAFMRFGQQCSFQCSLFTCLSCGWVVNESERRFVDGSDAFMFEFVSVSSVIYLLFFKVPVIMTGTSGQ